MPATRAKRQFAAALRRVCDATGFTKDVAVCAALSETYGYVGKSSLSRYTRGWQTPAPAFVEALYRLAERSCPPGHLTISLTELLAMRDAAATTTVEKEESEQRFARLEGENRRLREQHRPEAGPDAPSQVPDSGDPTGFQGDPPAGQENTQVSSYGRVARAREPETLPVGVDEGDRQLAASLGTRKTGRAATVDGRGRPGMTRTAPAAEFTGLAAGRTAGPLVRQLLERVGRATGSAHDAEAALSLLLDTAGSLTPGELCEVASLLRSAGQATLAESLVTAFARQQGERQVILAALALQRAHEDISLSLLLTTAARRHQ